MLLEIREETGITPQALLNRPTLLPSWRYSLDIWQSLSADRTFIAGPNGSIPSTIPFTVIMLYANVAGLTRHEAWDLWQELSIIDTIWLSISSKKRNAQAVQK